jgi:Cohesin domain
VVWSYRTRRSWRCLRVATVVALLTASSMYVTPAISTPVFAAGDSLRIDPATTTGAVGGTFTISVVGSTAGPVSGAQASVLFNASELHVVSIGQGSDWVDDGASFAGYPSRANMVTFIANANAAGKLPAIAAYFSDGVSTLAAGDHVLFSVNFQATACGNSGLDLATGPADGSMIDGAVGTYGSNIEVSAAGGTVSIPCTGGATPPPSSGSRQIKRAQSQAAIGSCPIGLRVEGTGEAYSIIGSEMASFQAKWPSDSVTRVSSVSDNQSLSDLQNGLAQVAVVSRALVHPEDTNLVEWPIAKENGSGYAYAAVLKPGARASNSSDNSGVVAGDDFLNHLLSPEGQTHLPANTGPIPIPLAQSILDYDVNLDGAVSLGDLGNITGRWGQTSACNGWIRADANNDGAVGLADLGKVTAHWGQVGYVANYVSPAPTGPAGSVIYVHGVNEGASDPQFRWNQLLSYLGPSGVGVPVVDFKYFEDSADCSRIAVQPSTVYFQSNTSIPAPMRMPVAWPPQGGSQGGQYCDSQSDVAIDAVLLDADVVQRYNATGKRVVLIGRSLGAMVIRGFLEYSSQVGDGAAANLVDSVVFLQGDQSGSDFAVHGCGVQWDPVLMSVQCLNGTINWPASLDTSRPAYSELIPQSAWYAWQNSSTSVAYLPNIPYFNVYSNITVHFQACVIPITDWLCTGIGDDSLGDLAMHPGSDAPTYSSGGGGAMFLRGSRGAQNWEWQATEVDTVSWDAAGPIWTTAQLAAVASQVTGSPVNHFYLPPRAQFVPIADCSTGAQTDLAAELEAIVAGRLDGYPHICKP